MSHFFTSLGRFSVRFRYLIVVLWIVGTVLAVKALPSLSDVAKDTTSGFLPANAPSMQAANLAAPFQNASLASATLVVARDGGLTAADNAAVDTLEAQIRQVPRVKLVLDLGVSSDGQARQALLQATVVAFSGGPEATGVVDAIRATFTTAGAPAGLQIHLTGQLATQIDTIKATGSSQDQTSQLSLLFIIVLLLLAFRAAARAAHHADPGGLRARAVGAGDRRVHEPRRAGLLDHPAPAHRADPGRGHRLRRLPRLPRARGAAARPDAAGGRASAR